MGSCAAYRAVTLATALIAMIEMPPALAEQPEYSPPPAGHWVTKDSSRHLWVFPRSSRCRYIGRGLPTMDGYCRWSGHVSHYPRIERGGYLMIAYEMGQSNMFKVWWVSPTVITVNDEAMYKKSR
jgi:hypothetical protein